ncbi:hypothetical protein C1N74_07690 [Microbacterium sp. SGAir0570]|uniref:hypothetical protein n=1 Tax=Microbacterium sp. SGAir0570 TaxID=2070348 RepID=UPI0010CD41E6|nr:hypothetical protein [Microbacterium sp. SGAir0570]QCR40315.1 hypothetical protein C1N74_07690 [Microbacterium sp. SGAir0570]
MTLADIITGAIALAALLVSILTFRFARKEPARARTRANRDQLRDALAAALGDCQSAEHLLGRGADLPAVPASVGNAEALVEAMKTRLQESARLEDIHVRLLALSMEWRSAVWAQERTTSTRDRKQHWEANARRSASGEGSELAERDRVTADEYARQYEEASRERTAKHQRVAEGIKEFERVGRSYIRALDSSDKAGRDLA